MEEAAPVQQTDADSPVIGEPPVVPTQEPVYMPASDPYTKYFRPQKRRGWRPWMTVTLCCVLVLALSVAFWASLLHVLSRSGGSMIERIEEQIQRYPSYAVPESLLRTWIQTGYEYYTGAEYMLELTFTEDSVSMISRTLDGEEDYGTYRYYLTDDDEIYLPELGESYEFYFNDNENMLTISPGIFTEWEEETWFNFEY